MKLFRLAFLSGLLSLVAGVMPASAEGAWGTIKGQVIWPEKDLPVRPELTVNANPKECLKNGPLLAETYIVDKATKGVKYVTVWLIPADAENVKDYKKMGNMPIHPALKAIKNKEVEVDQPCCMFIPSVIALREGQTLVAKNSSEIAHNVKIDGSSSGNPDINPIIPAGKSFPVPDWKATGLGAVPMSCSIHGWMKGHIRVFNHPYFAVTNDKGEFEIKDAPAGNFRIVMFHPTPGFINGDRLGKPITIKDGAVTDLGKVDCKPPKD